MSSTKAKTGRPSKYKTEYCTQLIEHMRGLNTFETFAADIGVNRDTLYQWCKEHEEFSDAKKTGTLFMRKNLENVGKGLMTGKIKGNVAAWIFYSKNTIGWGDDPYVEQDDNDDWEIE